MCSRGDVKLGNGEESREMFVLNKDVAVRIGLVPVAKRDQQIAVIGDDGSARVFEECGDGKRLDVVLEWESERVRFYAGLSGEVVRPSERCVGMSGSGCGSEDIGWWF